MSAFNCAADSLTSVLASFEPILNHQKKGSYQKGVAEEVPLHLDLSGVSLANAVQDGTEVRVDVVEGVCQTKLVEQT